MASKLTRADRAIVRLADGTVKQQNLLTGTEVWTVPGRGNRPLAAPRANHEPIDHEAHGRYCASVPSATWRRRPKSPDSCAATTGPGSSWTP